MIWRGFIALELRPATAAGVWLFFLTTTALAQPGPSKPSTESPPAVPPLRQIATNRFLLGTVEMDKAERSLRFPAVVNMSKGLVEYALVACSGKVHESVLRTDTEPIHLHLAALFLGARTNAAPATGQQMEGDEVEIAIEWKSASGPSTARIEDWIQNIKTQSALARGPWLYNGSRLEQGTFLAQRDGSIVSIIFDPDALINNPRPGREDDEIWEVNSRRVPDAGTAVDVIVQFRKKK
jgi:hypothetical protein